MQVPERKTNSSLEVAQEVLGDLQEALVIRTVAALDGAVRVGAASVLLEIKGLLRFNRDEAAMVAAGCVTIHPESINVCKGFQGQHVCRQHLELCGVNLQNGTNALVQRSQGVKIQVRVYTQTTHPKHRAIGHSAASICTSQSARWHKRVKGVKGVKTQVHVNTQTKHPKRWALSGINLHMPICTMAQMCQCRAAGVRISRSDYRSDYPDGPNWIYPVQQNSTGTYDTHVRTCRVLTPLGLDRKAPEPHPCQPSGQRIVCTDIPN